MSNQNSVAPFTGASSDDLLKALGVTQFPTAGNFYQFLGGLLVQGGLIENIATGTTVTFNAGFPKQVLVILITPVNATGTNPYVSAVTIDDFVINYGGGGVQDFYWYAIGV